MRATYTCDPHDEVAFGDPVDTYEEMIDRSDGGGGGSGDDVFELLDLILASDGVVRSTHGLR
jgi:hypothetical protein